jgi:hypothetical protein
VEQIAFLQWNPTKRWNEKSSGAKKQDLALELSKSSGIPGKSRKAVEKWQQLLFLDLSVE